MFPDDGHPDLAAYVANLTGDARDEIVLWDQERVWIYTQDRPFSGERIYAPHRNPDYNESNYRTVVSRPGRGRAGGRPSSDQGRATMKRPLGGVVTVVLAPEAVVHDLVRHESADWYVTPQGRADRAGTAEAPWDIASTPGRAAARSGRGIRSGSVRARITRPPRSAGTAMRCGSSAGRDTRSASVPCPARATIDGGLNLLPPATYVEIRDLEITVSEPRPAAPVPPDPSYRNVNRPWGGLNVNTGTGCKFINLVIHDNSQGVSWWSASRDSELYGCLIYDNGWAGTDRGHGHAVYTQNADGTKTIADCIMTGGHGYTLHAYGSSRADVDNYLVAGQHRLRGEHVPHRRRQAEPPHPRARQHPARRRDAARVLGTRERGLRGARQRHRRRGPEDNKFEQVTQERNLVLAKGEARPKGVRVDPAAQQV